MDPELDIGVPGGSELLAFAEAVIGADLAALDQARSALSQTLSPGAVAAASAVAANFTKNDRIANGLGIPVDAIAMAGHEDLREQLGLNDFRSAVNTFRHAAAG